MYLCSRLSLSFSVIRWVPGARFPRKATTITKTFEAREHLERSVEFKHPDTYSGVGGPETAAARSRPNDIIPMPTAPPCPLLAGLPGV